MDFSGDFNTFYWKAINTQIAHTRYYCIGCGRTKPRWTLRWCTHCPGNICDACWDFHTSAAKAIHKKPEVEPIIIIVNSRPPMPKPPPVPVIPQYRQSRFRARKQLVMNPRKTSVRQYRQSKLNFI